MAYKVNIIYGDITEMETEAIVNPANSQLVMGGGVALAVLSKGGHEIEQEAKKSAPVKPGMALITHAGKLKTRYVIHAVTMNENHSASEATIRKATYYALLIAEANKLKSVSFPAMGMGVGGLDAALVAQCMAEVFRKFSLESSILSDVNLVLFDQKDVKLFQETMNRVFI